MFKVTTNKLIQYLLTLLFLLSSSASFATWYQGSAHQKISSSDYDLDALRTLTIKKAITNASLKSGAFIKLESIVLDGLLQSSKTVFKNKGDIRRVEILSETINNDILIVMVKVDIDTLHYCKKDDYGKSVVVMAFPLVKPLQAISGELFELGSQISKRFEHQLYAHESIAEIQLLDKAFSAMNYLKALDQQNTLETSYYLATKYSSQFILFGYIEDISLFEQVKDNLLIDDVNLRRNFTIKLYLYDAFQSKILISKRYHGEADWSFDLDDKIDINNSVFWRSDYGRVILNTINSATIDINDRLTCQQSLTPIVNKQKEEIIINLGAKHGVKVSDKFEIVRKKLIHSHQGSVLPMLIVDEDISLHVKYVNHNSSVLISDNPQIVHDSQLFDLVSPKGMFKNE
ncbi:MAG: flagellar assembly protein FlgT [Colwellia sp.]